MGRDSKAAMVRLASDGESVCPDFEGRMGGRGGYLHPRGECLAKFAGSKIKQFRSLKRGVNGDERMVILTMIQGRLDSRALLQ